MINSSITEKIDISTRLKKSDLNKSYFIILGLSIMFFSRILETIGFNSLINFVHYAYFFILYILYYFIDVCNKRTTKIQNYILFLIIYISLSTIFNSVGYLNAVISFFIISQPFMLISLMVNIDFKIIEKFLHFIFIINAVFAYFQYIILGYRVDEVKGIFLNMGAGHHICGAVAILAMIYYFCRIKKPSMKWLAIALQFIVVFLCDNKQSLFVLIVSFIALIIIGRIPLRKKVILLALLAILCFLIYLFGMTVFPAIRTYFELDRDIYGLSKKLYIFQYLFNNGNILNVLFGYGAGMSVSRTAQNLVDYSFLSNFGATLSDMQAEIWLIQESNWITNSLTGSSMFSLYFSYAGFYGDFGIVGLLLILYGYWKFMAKKCHNIPMQLVMIFFLFHGMVFQWLEEPQFVAIIVLFIMILYNNKNISLKSSSKKLIYNNYIYQDEYNK